MKILITGGGCREYIDSVRVVTNSSTGRTSAELADYFSREGDSVTLITSRGAAVPLEKNVRIINYVTGKDLSLAIEKEISLEHYDAVIHAAAVSDFIPETITISGITVKAGKDAPKLPSGEKMTVTFSPSPKIADSLYLWAKKDGGKTKVICFKLLNNASEEEKNNAVEKLFFHSNADFVIYNDLSKITGDLHPFVLMDKNGRSLFTGNTNKELALSIRGVL